MTIVLSDISAALFWECWSLEGAQAPRRVMSPQSFGSPSAHEVEHARRLLALGSCEPLHLLVGSSRGRRRCPGFVTHCCTKELPLGSFFALGDDIFVAAPELAFVQAARWLSLEHLIHFGMMLCGLYRRDPVALEWADAQSASFALRQAIGGPASRLPWQVSGELAPELARQASGECAPDFPPQAIDRPVSGPPQQANGEPVLGLSRQTNGESSPRQFLQTSGEPRAASSPWRKRRLRKRAALTSASELRDYVERLTDVGGKGLKGIRTATRALPFVVDRSRSPMESALTMALCLPCKLGGFALPNPTLNASVYLGRRDNLAGGVRWDSRGLPYFECDLVWGDERVIVEYHGDGGHFTREGAAKDARKANILLGEGFKYYVATIDTMSALRFPEFAHRIRLDLHRKFQTSVKGFEQKGIELRNMLQRDYLLDRRVSDIRARQEAELGAARNDGE